MSFCKDCIRGVQHEGTPKGTIEKIGGVDTYVTLPDVDYPKDKAIIFLSDVFGTFHLNSKLLADDFAANGFAVYSIDFLNGDPIKAEDMNREDFNLMDWLKNHGSEQTTPTIMAGIAGLKEKGITSFGATGYCFGARYVFNLAFDNLIKASVVAHPSLIQVPDDLEKYLNSSKAPLLINSCEHDEYFPDTSSEKADEVLGGGKFKPGYLREYWPGCTHGFAIRGDHTDPKVLAGKEGAFKSSVEWFIKHL